MKHCRFCMIIIIIALTGFLLNVGVAFGIPIIGPKNTATIIHNPGFPAGPGGPLPFATPAAFPFFQYPSNTFAGGPGGASSTGVGGISHIIRPNLFGLMFPSGTGISQTAPGGGVAPASLRIDFDVDFLLDAGGFGPPVFEFGYFPLVGTVGGGAGDFVKFTASATFTSTALGKAFGPGINLNFLNFAPGPFTNIQSFVSAPLGPLPAMDTVNIKGFIEFQALNQSGPSDIAFSSAGGFNPIPEPATMFLLGSGLVGLVRFMRMKKK